MPLKRQVFRGRDLAPFVNRRCLLLSVSSDKSCYTLTLSHLRHVNSYPETQEIELIFDNHSVHHYPGNGWNDILFTLPTPREVAGQLPFFNRFC